MSEPLNLGEPADEAAWRALVDQGLKGAGWERLLGRTADGVEIAPLYRETDAPTAGDPVGFPGQAPFVRGARAGAWTIRQVYAHPDPEQTNAEILADLAGGVGGVELAIDPEGAHGIAIREAGDLDRALAQVILEAAPVSLDAGAHGAWAARLLREKLKGVAAPGTAFNLDPLGAFMREGALCGEEHELAIAFASETQTALPAARCLRIDARIVHEAGGGEAQEIASALCAGIHYLRALNNAGMDVAAASRTLAFAVSVGPDLLIETAKLRALRLCWARCLEACGADAEARAAYLHAFTSRRAMTRYDAHTNILRITTCAFAAAIGGADAITTYPFTDALGLPTPFARRVARNTQHVLLEECRLAHVADPAGGAWFVEKLTQQVAAKAWEIMQAIESQGGIVAALNAGWLQARIGETRTARKAAFARRKETITGVSDFPLLGAVAPEVVHVSQRAAAGEAATDAAFAPIRWAAPFEALRHRGEAKGARIFFANLGALLAFGPRAQFARNLFAAGGVDSIGPETAYDSTDALSTAFAASGARVAVIAGADAAYAEQAANAARALKAAGATWVVLAGKPGDREAAWRDAGVDQFVFTGQDVLAALETLHAALGVT